MSIPMYGVPHDKRLRSGYLLMPPATSDTLNGRRYDFVSETFLPQARERVPGWSQGYYRRTVGTQYSLNHLRANSSVEGDRRRGECDILLAAEIVGERGDYCRGHLNSQMLHAIPQNAIVSILLKNSVCL